MSAETDLATFAADLTWADIPETVRSHACLVLADTVAATVGGSTDPDVRGFVGEACERTPGRATVIGHGATTSRYLAAFANGAAGTVLELDEGHKFAAGHPAIHVLPALLADAEVDAGSGRDLLVAFVVGYEAAARAGRACYPLAAGYHPHGVWGPVGAAVGVAVHRGYDAEDIRTAARIAAKDAQHTLMAAATEGATVRQAFAGGANLSGLLAADLAAAGFSGVEDGVARHLDLAADGEVDREALGAELGERWDVTLGYFKRHAACRYTHPTIDAVEALLDDGLDPATVERVRVETYPTAAGLTETHPRNALQAKFSVPFAVATRLVHSTAGKAAFVDDAIDDAALALADRVEVVATDEMRDRLPDRRSARVTMRTTDGTSVTEEVVHAAGGAERPYDEAAIHEKFDALVRPVLGDTRRDTLWAATREGPADPQSLCALLRADD
ncbi:MmgE/PrpD family protein [Halomarina ordinaria]|uniref:MmgE/PrpD family protein n=1 Tax=Halomarina ordinaria TaxID=3033939 RepID=A0ABD5UC08_9EURY|nr:MmgE/PrpD family protein [Halomarina sp. PSRA2]